jgi:site-specific DNA-methyltransferase (adenine-specific)
MGQYLRGKEEHCLFGVKWSLPYKIFDDKRQQSTTLLLSDREKHSKKPDEMRKRIEKVSDRNGFHKIELFARALSPGWDIFGNEIQENNNAE